MRDTSDMDVLNRLYKDVRTAEDIYRTVTTPQNEWRVRLALKKLEKFCDEYSERHGIT